MKRSLAILAGGLIIALLAGPGQTAQAGPDSPKASGAQTSGATASPTCTYKWKKKRVVRKVRRHGKLVRIVRYRHYRVCVPVTPPAPERLGVRAFEYGLTLSSATKPAGDTIVELSNRGEDAHDLHIRRTDDTTGATEVAVPETLPSTYERVRFNTEPGTYRLWCSLPTHADLGMQATLTVTP